ncbi:hypothetical protein ACH3WN_32100 [Streptomyces albogriseolus]
MLTELGSGRFGRWSPSGRDVLPVLDDCGTRVVVHNLVPPLMDA